MSNFVSTKWDRFLVEDETAHFPWLKEIQATDDLEEIQAIVESDRFKKVGGGSFRKVYEPVGDPEHVIKVIHDPDEYKMRMNEDDFDTARRYPFIFPKAYAHADDFSWIVMEKTPPLIYPEDMQKVLDQSFPEEQEALLKKLVRAEFPGGDGWWAQWNPADPFHIMKMIMASFRFARKEAPDLEAPVPSPETQTAQDMQDLIVPIAGRTYYELSKVMHEFAIDKYEIGRGNIGHDKDYNFKIVDSSVFDPDWDPEDASLNEGTEEEPDLLRFSDELNNRISSLLLQQASADQLNQQDTESEATIVLDTGELFENYDTLNEVHLGIIINDEGAGSIKAFYLCDIEERGKSNLVIVANIPRGYETIEDFPEWFAIELEDALSHELQHSCDPTDMLSADIPEGEEKWASLENIYKHFASEAETRGHLAGARGRARRSGRDLEEIVDNAVNQIFEDALEYGYTVEELTPVIQAIWEKWNNYLAGWNE
jgi:hypothetical protein